MMNINEFFGRYYKENGMNKGRELENMVWDWYNNDEEKFDKWVEENNIELYDVEEMMDGSEEYSIDLWVEEMKD